MPKIKIPQKYEVILENLWILSQA